MVVYDNCKTDNEGPHPQITHESALSNHDDISSPDMSPSADAPTRQIPTIMDPIQAKRKSMVNMDTYTDTTTTEDSTKRNNKEIIKGRK